MKTIFRSIIAICFLSVSSYSYSQLSKQSCQDIFEGIDVKSFQKLRVITKSPNDNNSHGVFNFEVDSYNITFNDTYFKIKDASGLTLYISYEMIKMIKTSPKSNDEFSNVTFYLVE